MSPTTALARDELDFQAPALRIARSPAHPLPRVTAAVLIALVSCAILWSWLGEVDIVAVAPGRILATDRSRTVQSLERGVVRQILVRDGDQVRAGQALLMLDTTVPQADLTIAEDQGRHASEEIRRAQALLGALASATFDALPPAVAAVPSDPVQTEWQQIASRHARLRAEVQRRLAEVATAKEAVAKLDAALPLTRQREEDIQHLARQGFVSQHAGQDRARERQDLERDLALQRARTQEALAGLAEAEVGRDAHLAETRHALTERLVQARLRAATAAQEVAKASERTRLLTLRSPAGGRVQQLAIHTLGGVVTEAQPLLVIVPDEADPQGPAVEIEIDSKDIGFVVPGQSARVKLEAFPYTRHGTLESVVEFVAADGVVADGRGTFFPSRLRLRSAQITVDGRPVGLTAGMVVTAEIRTGSRRILDFLLSPLQRAASESLRER